MLNKEWNEKWINRARKEFENFKADIQNLGTLTVIDWRNQDGSGNWRVRYILDGCRLIITGDLGSAVFRRAEPYTLEHCSTMLKNLSYEAGKCQADGSRSGEGIYSWSYSYIEQDLKGYFKDYYSPEDKGLEGEEKANYNEEVEELIADLCESADDDGIHVTEEHMDRLSRISDGYASWEDAVSISNCGKQYSVHFIAWLVGLKMICDQYIHEFVDKVCLSSCDLNGCRISAWKCPKLLSYSNEEIAVKRWSREDIRACLESEGYHTAESDIDAVIDTGYLDALNDCTDADWQIIYDAIAEAVRRGDITRE